MKPTVSQQELLVLISLMDTYERLVDQLNKLKGIKNTDKVFFDSSSFVAAEVVEIMGRTLDKCKSEKERVERLQDLNLIIGDHDGKRVIIPS